MPQLLVRKNIFLCAIELAWTTGIDHLLRIVDEICLHLAQDLTREGVKVAVKLLGSGRTADISVGSFSLVHLP